MTEYNEAFEVLSKNLDIKNQKDTKSALKKCFALIRPLLDAKMAKCLYERVVEKRTYASIGWEMNIHPEWARQLTVKAINRLKR